MKVIVTGASKGIGRGIAQALAAHGYTLGLTARSEELLLQLQRELRSGGCRCAVATADLRSWESTQRAVENLAADLDGIDAIINNAGLIVRKDVLTIEIAEWQAMMETNINGVFYMIRAALPYLRRSDRGHIVNISSISGRMPLPGGSGYAASKYAVSGFSESIFQELRELGIKVTVIFPGSVDSRSHRHAEGEDASWKVQPMEVGEACHDILDTSPGTCISRLEIRPLRRAAP